MAWEAPGGRVGTILSLDGNGLYTIDVDGVQYLNVPSSTAWTEEFFVGQTVRVAMIDEQVVIISSP